MIHLALSVPNPKRSRVMSKRSYSRPATAAKRSFDDLPEELKIDILKRLPIKFLMRFKCVCKEWLSLISSREFAMIHMRYHPKNNNKLMTFASRCWLGLFSLFSIDEKSTTSKGFLTDARSPPVPEGGYRFLGACNGLLCFHASGHRVLLWNPATGKYRTLPDVLGLDYIGMYGFGYDARTEDYKVVYAYHKNPSGEPNTIKVFSLNAWTWTTVEAGFSSGFTLPNIGTWLGDGPGTGTINWCNNLLDMENWKWEIASFHLNTNTVRTIAVPPHEWGTAMSISESRGLIYLTSHRLFNVDLWVMKEFGDVRSWTFVTSFPHVPKQAIPRALGEFAELIPHIVYVPFVAENDDFIIRVKSTLRLKRSDGRRGKFFDVPQKFDGCYTVISYLETLVEP